MKQYDNATFLSLSLRYQTRDTPIGMDKDDFLNKTCVPSKQGKDYADI